MRNASSVALTKSLFLPPKPGMAAVTPAQISVSSEYAPSGQRKGTGSYENTSAASTRPTNASHRKQPPAPEREINAVFTALPGLADQSVALEINDTSDASIPTGENYEYSAPRSLAGYSRFVDGASGGPAVIGVQQALAAHRRNCAHSFRVGDRGDMKDVMRPIFKGLRLCEVREADQAADVQWTRPWADPVAFFRRNAIAVGSIVNSIGGLPQQVGVKPSLASLQLQCFKRFGYHPLKALPPGTPHCQFTKRAFQLERSGDNLQMQYRAFRNYNMHLFKANASQLPHQIWILKSRNGFNQVGIHMYSLPLSDVESDQSMSRWLSQRVPQGEWVFQEYIMSPMTFKGHKFDLRVWSIVTSLDPLRMHLLGTGIPKVSSWRYKNDPEYAKNQCIHVLFPGTSECYFSKNPLAEILKPYPQRTDEAFWYENMDPVGESFWRNRAWPTVEHRLSELMLLARDAILHIDHQIKRKGLRYKRVFFLQPDFVFDSEGNGHMVEVNTNGYMIGNLHSAFFNVYDFQVAVVKLMGAHGYPKKRLYKEKLRLKISAFCKSHSCPGAFPREIAELVHEEMHASLGWYRIFPRVADYPASDARGYMNKFLSTPEWRSSFTPLDELMLKWLETRWWPKHVRDSNNTVHVYADN